MCCERKGTTSRLEKFDIFGAPIGITFKGKDTFKTPIGGIMSICSVTLILVALVFELSILFSGKFSKDTSQTIISSNNA